MSTAPGITASHFSHGSDPEQWNASTRLEYAVTHVFLPAQLEALPSSGYAVENDHWLARAVCAAAQAYSEIIDDILKPQWSSILKMLAHLQASVMSERLDRDRVVSQLRGMQSGDILVFLHRAQETAVIFRKQDHCTLCESFETSWDSAATFAGSHSEWAIEIPDEVFHDQYFQSELANFLLYPGEFRSLGIASEDTTSSLLTSVLRSVGRRIEVPSISRHVHSHYKFQSWPRSSLWLLIKVAIKTSLDHGDLGRVCYKVFILHFMCNLSKNAIDANLSSRLLHATSVKILRRLRKLDCSVPNWLCDMVLKTSACLREILETRWKEVAARSPSPLWQPTLLDIARDTQLSLMLSKDYICNSLSKPEPKPLDSPPCPKHPPHGTLHDFLSSNGSLFEEAYRIHPLIALYDVERAVEEGIDDWVACVTDVDQASVQLEILMDKYLSSSLYKYNGNPEHISIMLLTVIELWVALDKLVVGVAPKLANYSPEVPTELLHRLLLHETTNLHRLCRVYQYLSSRHSRFHPGWSVFSDEFTQKMFPVHRVNSPANVNSPDLWHQFAEYGPTGSPHVEITVFELQCPVSLHIWRSATARIRDTFFCCLSIEPGRRDKGDSVPLFNIPWLQPYLVKHWTSPVTSRVYLTCLIPSALQSSEIFHDISKDYHTGIIRDEYFGYRLPSEGRGLHQYVNSTTHAPNGVLVAQAECPDNLSLHEFIAFGHLRSGGSLQWLNILRELRGRTLNFRRHDVYLLLAQAATQVGPLDLNAMEWVWHQELQESSFCYTLLDELESLLVEVGAQSLDGVMMGNIAFLLTRLLVSSPDEDISEQAIGLLRRVRRKTFHWVQELSYDLMMAPTKTERNELLRDMAATCRSTFDVGPDQVHKVLRSVEDIDALLSCAIFIHANVPVDSRSIPEYSRLLLERDRRLSLTLEGVLRELIRADMSDRGVDLAVRKVWSSYRPGPRRWQLLPHPNSHWLTCETAVTGTGRSQIVHLSLLDGTLLVDSKPLDGLPRKIREQLTYKRIFGDQAFLVIASDLPGMDFCTLALISQHRVHFALRGGSLVIWAQHRDTADIFEVIPQEKLQGDLPTAFVYGHVHWLNLSTSIIEIRPLHKLWEQSLENWRIDCASGQYRMYKGREWLVDVRSPTWEMVSSRLKRLDVPENLVITTFPIDTPQLLPIRRLSVSLARYGLSFFVNGNGDLESGDFKDMIYDENQCVGALFGLENRLVLRPNDLVEEELVHRYIIIPDGQVSRKQHNHHVHVSIDIVSTKNTHLLPVTYHTYNVNTDLGCLTGHISWRSKLYLAHLHAQTSVDWWPDPLTGRTGVQEALCLLRSAGCRSIMELDTRHKGPDFLFSHYYKMYPQLNFAIEEISYLIKRQRFLCNNQDNISNPPQRPQLDVIGALRTAYLFPFEEVGPMPVPVGVRLPKWDKSLDHEDLAYTISLAIYLWLIRVDKQGTINPADTLIRAPAPAPASSSVTEVAYTLPHEAEEFPPRYWQDPNAFPPSISRVDTLLREARDARQRFRLLFFLPSIVFRQKDPRRLLSILIALTGQILLNTPQYHANQHLDGSYFSKDALRNCFAKARRPQLFPQGDEVLTVDSLLHQLLFVDLQSETALMILMNDHLYDAKKLNTELQTLFSSCYRFNFKHTVPNPARPSQRTSDPASQVHCRTQVMALDWLLRDRSTPQLPPPSRLRCGTRGNRLSSDSNSDTLALNQLFTSLRIDKTAPFQQQYFARLLDSARHARAASHMACGVTRPSTAELQRHYVQCRNDYLTGLTVLKRELGPKDDPLGQALDWSGQWPHVAPDTLFRLLASTSPVQIPDKWKKCLVSLALLLVELQRSRRLLRYALDKLEEEFFRELENEGCDWWSAEEHPDWLLIQLQGNFFIRRIQADVAIKMISPPSGENTAMQVNMGEGKSSVILPISAATLADGDQLVRVIVPKALTVQMFRLLVDRLGGLVNRPIYYLPFSRSLTNRYSPQQFESMRELMSECIRDRGILVAQPEHVLSLKLTSIQGQLPRYLCNGDSVNSASDKSGVFGDQASGSAFVELQRWVQSYSRDILDESDEVLHPRFQLIYTIGLEQHTEGYPDRWTTTQQVLRLVKKHLLSLSNYLPEAIEYELGPSGSFPRIRILRASDTRQHLLSLIVDDVMDGHLPSLSFRDIDGNRPLRDAVRAFISSKDVFQPTARMVEEYAQKSVLRDGLLLLRGLFACNILFFALAERRWRVDYGLSPKRTMLAVPYRAKDVPAPTAEFGHPDIAIVLTCLSYYYGGLAEEQLRVSFEILQEQDDPSLEYANWLRDYDPASVPVCILDLSNVNTKSSEQWDKYLFPLFARNQGAVDFYLSRVVFPREAKEFPRKLAASSWDLAERRERPITGFSGTNDSQYLLPTSITQRDLDHQRGTNASILAHLLQPKNNSYTLISHPNGQRRTTLELLKMVVDQEPAIRVILDVGAQILDFSNYQLAKAWLNLSSDSDGAIFFSEDDELMVLTKDGTHQTLLSSPLSGRLDRCIVYLDDAHTRGTDLKFPSGFRAAVTLGPKVTKDRLVQGCMRMRKLGHGHSVMFFAPLEVDQSIRVVATKEDQTISVTTTDILRWAIHETWVDTQRWAPYWVQQGISHESRYDAWICFCRNELTGEQLADAWLQPELKSLADLYAPFQPRNNSTCLSFLDDHREIQQHCIDLGVLKLPEAQMEEEQEREVSREIEREREGQRQPPNANQAMHSVHLDLENFVNTGHISQFSRAFVPAFTAVEQSFAARSDSRVYSPFILATVDFHTTIRSASSQGKMDHYLRPVQWVLSGKMDQDRVLVLLSPFEADHLMPYIRVSKFVHLHVYTPCTSERMKPTNDLRFHSIPPVPDSWTPPWDLIDQLNVFAGQLYLRDYESYLRLRRFLGIQVNDLPNSVRTAVRRNLVTVDALQEIGNTIRDSPLPSVMMLLAIRRRGLPFAETHMGRILQGHQLTEEDFKILPRAKIGHNPITRDAQMLRGIAQLATGGDGAVSPMPKRAREAADSDPPDGDSGRPQKRLLVDHWK